MYVYSFNNYNGRYYCYDVQAYNINSDMFDWTLHNNDDTPMIKERNACAYCNTLFLSRNRLFYHLGFMNINTTRQIVHPTYDRNPDVGEYGLVKSKRSARKLLQFHKKIRARRQRQRIVDLSRELSKLSVTITKG